MQVKHALRSEASFDNFLRTLKLCESGVLTIPELAEATKPFFRKHEELAAWFKTFVNYKEGVFYGYAFEISPAATKFCGGGSILSVDIVVAFRRFAFCVAVILHSLHHWRNVLQADDERGVGEVPGEGEEYKPVDYNACKRLGFSYRALPKGYGEVCLL